MAVRLRGLRLIRTWRRTGCTLVTASRLLRNMAMRTAGMRILVAWRARNSARTEDPLITQPCPNHQRQGAADDQSVLQSWRALRVARVKCCFVSR